MPELIGENLAHRYGSVEALRGVDITLRPGSVHALIGPSGSGKSTLLMLLAGLIRPTSGRVLLRDNGTMAPVVKPPPALGMVFQPPGLWDHLTVEQHLKLVAPREPQFGCEVLEMMSIAELRRRRPGELSSGQRQRLSLARALAARPRWLLLDEPLAHLDGQARTELVELLRKIFVKTGAAVLIATHQPDEVNRLCDTVTMLHEGREI